MQVDVPSEDIDAGLKKHASEDSRSLGTTYLMYGSSENNFDTVDVVW